MVALVMDYAQIRKSAYMDLEVDMAAYPMTSKPRKLVLDILYCSHQLLLILIHF